MKCFVAIALLALFAVALAAPEPEKLEPVKAEADNAETAVRDKRGLLVAATYTAPVAYSAYSAPITYTSSYSYPYAYSAYRTYPYVHYSSPIVYA